MRQTCWRTCMPTSAALSGGVIKTTLYALTSLLATRPVECKTPHRCVRIHPHVTSVSLYHVLGAETALHGEGWHHTGRMGRLLDKMRLGENWHCSSSKLEQYVECGVKGDVLTSSCNQPSYRRHTDQLAPCPRQDPRYSLNYRETYRCETHVTRHTPHAQSFRSLAPSKHHFDRTWHGERHSKRYLVLARKCVEDGIRFRCCGRELTDSCPPLSHCTAVPFSMIVRLETPTECAELPPNASSANASVKGGEYVK